MLRASSVSSESLDEVASAFEAIAAAERSTSLSFQPEASSAGKVQGMVPKFMGLVQSVRSKFTVLSKFEQSKNIEACAHHNVETFILLLLPKGSIEQYEEARASLQEVNRHPWGHAILRAFCGYYKGTGQLPQFTCLRGPHPEKKRYGHINDPLRGNNLGYLDLTAASKQKIVELATVYSNMTGVLEGADPFEQFLTKDKSSSLEAKLEKFFPLDEKLAVRLQQWMAEASSSSWSSREKIVRDYCVQLQRQQCYGDMDLADLRALLTRIKEMPDSDPNDDILGVAVNLEAKCTSSNLVGDGYSPIPPQSEDIQSIFFKDFLLTEKSVLSKNIKVLKLKNCQIDPEFSLSSYPSLHTLCIENCDLTHLKKSFFPKNIKTLEFKNCEIFDVIKRKLVPLMSSLPSVLQTLRIKHCNCGQVIKDRHIMQLLSNATHSLITLDLSNNQLQQLPPKLLDKLKHLKYLDVSRNQLAALPAFLENLSSKSGLSRVNLAGNPLPLGCVSKEESRLLLSRLWNGCVIENPMPVEQAIRLWLHPITHLKVIKLWDDIALGMTPAQQQGFSDFLSYLHEQRSSWGGNFNINVLHYLKNSLNINVNGLKDQVLDFEVAAWLILFSEPGRMVARSATFNACAAVQANSSGQRASLLPLNDVMKFWLQLRIEQGQFDSDKQIKRLLPLLRQIFHLEKLCEFLALKGGASQLNDQQYLLSPYEIISFLAYLVNDALDPSTIEAGYIGVGTPLAQETLREAAQSILKNEEIQFAPWLMRSRFWQTVLCRMKRAAYEAGIRKQQELLQQGSLQQEFFIRTEVEWAKIRGDLRGFLQQLQAEWKRMSVDLKTVSGQLEAEWGLIITGLERQSISRHTVLGEGADKNLQQGSRSLVATSLGKNLSQEALAKAEVQQILESIAFIKHMRKEGHARPAEIAGRSSSRVGDRRLAEIQKFIASIAPRIAGCREALEHEISYKLLQPLSNSVLRAAGMPDDALLPSWPSLRPVAKGKPLKSAIFTTHQSGALM
jgi:Leucine-rich repeat (LRR) protein